MDLGFLKAFRRLLVLATLLGVLFASLASGTRPAHAATGINQTIGFQGRLLTSSGAAVPDGFYNIEFKIYQDGDGLSVGNTTGSPTGSLKWTEDYLNSASHGVRVINGYMSVQLGSVNAFGSSIDWNQNTLWLSMNIGNTNVSCTPFSGCSGDGEMVPMQPLTTAVYALNANQLGGLTSAAFAQLAATQTFTGANTFQPTGNVTGVKVIQSSAGAPTADIFNVQSANNTNLIQVTGPSANNAAITLRSVGAGNAITLTSAGALNFTGGAASVWDLGGNTLSIQTANNGAITTGSGLLTVGGSQTFSGANPVISASSSNTSLTIQTNGTGTLNLNTTGAGTVNVGTTNTTTVGIGNNGSTTAVTTTGGATAQTISNTGELIKTSTNSATAFQVQNSSNVAALLVDTTTQRVGIGTTAPGSALEVNGDIYLTKEAARVIKVDASTTASTAGGALTISAGTGNAASGGALTLNGGGAINSTGNGGNVAINGGNAASGGLGSGGNVTITGGVGAAVGNITLQGGTFFNNYGAVSLNTTGNGKLIVGSNKSAVQIDTNQNLITSGTNTTSAALAVPVISTVSTGSSFYYGITAYNGQGETLLSNTVGMSSSSATITWTAIAGATGYKIYRNTSNSFTSGSLLRTTTTVGFSNTFTDDGTATGAGLPPTTSTGTKTVLQAWSGQTGDIQQWQNSAGTVLANVTAAGLLQAQSGLEVASTGSVGTVEKFRVNTPTTVDNLANAILTANTATSKALVIQAAASQSANLQEWQDSSGTLLAAISPTGRFLAQNGLVGTPSYSFAGQLSTGFYIPAANNIGVSANGSEVARFTTTGLEVASTGSVGTVEKFRVNTPTTVDNLAASIFSTGATTSKGLVVQGVASQTADLQQYQDSNGAVLAKVSSAGGITTNGVSSTFGALAVPTISSTSTSATGGTLAQNTTYWYVMTATNAAGETIASTSVSQLTGNTTATNTNTLNWTQIAGATGYKIYRNTSNSFTSGTLLLTTITNGSTATYIDTGSATSGTFPAASTTGTKLTIQGWNGQSGDLQQWQNSAGTVLSGINNAGALFNQTAAINTTILQTQVSGDTQSRFLIDNTGRQSWSTGAATPDLVLDRVASNTLRLSNSVTSSSGNAATLQLGGYYSAGASYRNGVVISSGTSTTFTGSIQLNSGGSSNGILSASATNGGSAYFTLNTALAIASITSTAPPTVAKFLVGTPSFTDNAANVIITASATTSKPLVIQGVTSQAVSLQEWQNSSGTALASIDQSGNLAAGTINTNTFGASALTFSGASPVISASTSNTGMTLQSNGTGTLTLNSTGAGTVNVGTTNTTTIGIGNTTAATATTIQGGTGSSAVSIQSGSGGTISVGSSGVANTVQIGNTSGAVTQTVNVGTNATAGSSTLLSSGSTVNGSNVSQSAGSGSYNLKLAGYNNLITNGDFETNVTGWTAQGTGVRSQTTAQKYFGNASMSKLISSGIPAGVIYDVTSVLNPSTQYTFSMYARSTLGMTLDIGAAYDGVTNTACGSTVISTTWTYVTCTFTSSGSLSTPYVFARDATAAVGNTFYIDGVVLIPTAATTAYSQFSAGNGFANLGNNGFAQTVTVGSLTGASATTIQAGTGSLLIQTQGTGTLGIGNNGVSQNIAIGNGTGATTVAVDCGTGVCTFGATATDHSTTVGSSTGASPTTIQGGTGNLNIQTQGTGNLNIGANAVAQNIFIGNSTGGTNVSINCGTGTCGLGTNGVDHSTTVGSTTGASLTTIQSGSSGISLNGAIVSSTGAINGVTLGASLLTFSGANPVVSASTTNTGLTVQSNGTGTLTLNSTGAGTVNVGTTNTTTVGIGNSTAATTVTSTGGATVQTVANTGVTVKTNTNSISALQVKDTGNAVIFNVDTTTGAVGTVSTSTASTASRALLLQSGATTGTTSNSGDVTLQSGGASTSGNSGAVAIKTGDVGLGNSGAISLDVGTASSGTVGAITIGTVNARSTTIGNTSSGSSTVINGGTGIAGVSIQSAASGGISIGTTANTSILFGTGAVGGTIKIGGTTQTGTITLGQSTASNTIEIGGGTTSSGNVQTVNIANGTGAGTATNVNILSGVGTAGTGTLSLGNNTRVTQIDLGNVAAAAARSINIGTGANVVDIDTINIGTGSTTVAGGKTIHIGDTAPSGSGTNLLTLGSTVNASTTTIQGGTGASAITLTQGTGGGIVIGGTGAASTVAIQCGAGTATTCGFANNGTDHSTFVGSSTGTSVTTIQGGSGGVVINSNTAINGTINSNTFSASALTFSGANPVISASTTNTGMTVQSNGTGTLTLNSSGAGTVNVGTTNTTTVGIGNTTAATTTSINGGTGANAVSIQSGSGGTISLGTTGVASTIQIGTTTAVATQTIGIGNNATATSVSNITIGNLLGSSNTLVQGGTGASAIALTQGTGGGIVIGSTGAGSTVSIQCGSGTSTSCGFANNATDHTTTVGSVSGVSATNIQSGTGGIGLNGNTSVTGTLGTTGTINGDTLSTTALTFTGTNPVISTSSTNSGFTLQANGTGTLVLNTSGSGTVNVGTTNTTTVAAGNTGAGTTVTLTGGATTTTVANAGTTVKTSTNSTTALQVQNAAGAAILAVNTSTPQVAFTATAVNAVNGTPLVNTGYTSTNTTAGTETAQNITVSDTGVVTSGTETTNGLSLSVTHTGQTGGTVGTNGITLQVNMDNAGAGTSTGAGVYSLVTGSADSVAGVGGGFIASGATTTGTATGVQGSIATAFFSGTISNAIGLGAAISSQGGVGTITNAYGVQVASASVFGGGTIGANYGIQVQPQTVGTTNYGVAIGTASTSTLQVGYDADGTTANAGISFGATAGTAANLYRGADKQLKTDSDLLVKSGTNSIAALSVQNSSGTNIFAVDTINGTVGTVKTTTASTPTQALTLQSGTAVGTGSGTGNVTLQSGASTVSGTTGSLTLTTGAATSGSSGSITLDVGTATGGTLGSISIGTANSRTIGVGNTTAATAVTIQGGTGASAISLTQGTGGGIVIGGSGASSTVSVLCGAGATNCGFANNATDHSTAFGSSTGTSATTVQGGSGGLTLSAGTINLNSATISTNQSSISLLDTTAATVTALQSATSITMGATSGTLTLRNAAITLGSAAGSGSFTNNGGTTNITLPLGDFPSGGSIGTNSSTVDIYTSISVNQSTASRTLTIPTPSANITYGRLLYLSNIGSASFTVGSATISAGTTATLVWSNTTGGASWQFAGADAASILNQNSIDQTANFRISGTGRANTSFTAPLFDSISGAVGLGTSTASAVNIGNATASTAITASCGASGTCAFGSNATDHTTTLGSATGTSATTINAGSAGVLAKSTSTTAFQVQNASGTSVFIVDTSGRQLKVMENGGSTNYALIYYDTATTTANYTASSGTVAVGTGAGAISVVAGSGSGITITSNAAALWRTTAGTLTLQSGTNSNLVLTPSGTGMATITGSAKLVLGQSAGDPGTCTVGALVYNTTSNTLRGCQGSTPTWNDVINVTTPNIGATYTASTGGTTAEIKLDTTRGALDVQGDNAGAVTDLFNVRAGTASGLGQSVFDVASSGNTTIQSSAGIAELSTTSLDVTIGQGNTNHSTNPVVLVLDNYQPITGTAPTEQDGAMYYNADQNIFMCGNNGQWTNCAINQIQSSYVFEDEFLGGTTSAATGTSFQGVGALGWNVNATTSCAAAYNQTGPALAHDHPGTLRLTTAAASGNGCAMTQAGTAAGTATLSQIIGAGDVFKTNVAISAQTGTMRVGWTNQTSNTAPTSGAWWEYNTTADATHLRYCYANNAAATCAAGPVIAANTWAELEIYINSASNITFVTNINGTPTSVTTTNAFDTGATNKLGPGATCYASTTTALSCYLDYIQWSGVNTSTHGIRD